MNSLQLALMGGGMSLASFAAPINRKLYGTVGNDPTGRGEAYSVSIKTGVKEDILLAGNNNAPYGKLYVHQGLLYGTTSDNTLENSFQNGTVYSLKP